jgi:hypothetical protein
MISIKGSVRFQLWMRVCHTSRFQQVASMQCFSGAMAKPFVVERTATDNATFQFCLRVRPISRFLLGFTQCFSAMMAVCYLVEAPMTSYDQQHRIPPLEDGVAYTQVAAGGIHSVLLRSDGSAVACGGNNYGQCDIPPLEEGLSYLQVSAGGFHTVLLSAPALRWLCGGLWGQG